MDTCTTATRFDLPLNILAIVTMLVRKLLVWWRRVCLKWCVDFLANSDSTRLLQQRPRQIEPTETGQGEMRGDRQWIDRYKIVRRFIAVCRKRLIYVFRPNPPTN